MKKIFLPTCLLLTLFATSCNSEEDKTDSKAVAVEQNDKKEDSTKIDNDADFAVLAADGGMLEEKLGKLAQANGTSAKVKELGKMMEMDHGMANNELKALATKYNVSLPADLSNEKQEKYNDLAAKKGADFDKAYASFMVDEHEKTINKFKKEAEDGKNADIKSWATGKIPALEHHLEMSKTTNDAVK